MRKRSTRSRNSALWLCVGLALAAPAFAGRPPAAAASQQEARATFKQAQDAYGLGEFEKALPLYARVYELTSSPLLLFNMAQCHRNLKNYERAAFFYRRFVDAAPKDTDTSTAAALASEMEAKAAEQAKLNAEQTARAEAQKRQEAAEAHQRELELQQARMKAAQAEAEAARLKTLPRDALPPPASVTPATKVEPSPFYKTWWFWTGVGVVAAGTVTAVALAQPHAENPVYGTIDAR